MVVLSKSQYKTFSAAGAEITFKDAMSTQVRPKGQMINALQVAIDFSQQTPWRSTSRINWRLWRLLPLDEHRWNCRGSKCQLSFGTLKLKALKTQRDLTPSIADQMNAELGSERVLPHPQRPVLQHEAEWLKRWRRLPLLREVMEDLGITQSLNRSVVVQMDPKISFMGIQHQISLPVAKTCMVALNTLASKPWNAPLIPLSVLWPKIETKRIQLIVRILYCLLKLDNIFDLINFLNQVKASSHWSEDSRLYLPKIL